MPAELGTLTAARLDLRGVTVRFGDFTANDAIDLAVGAGEIHALLGENGAGKTTLMRVVAGLLEPQQGEIRIDGRPVRLASPLDAADHGIGMVHQHFMLIPTLTVAQNVCLGLRRAGRFFPDLRKVSAEVREISRRYRMDVDPAALVSDLSVAGQQRVEIVKALYRGARILVLDEPTAVLSPSEVDGLFDVLRELAAEGTSIIFISHKLKEVIAISDRVTVLRHGRAVSTRPTAETSPAEISRLMIGSDLMLPSINDTVPADAPALVTVRGLKCRNERGSLRVDGVDLVIRAGEIIGLAGVDGNGQQELAEVLVGLRKAEAGTIHFADRDITSASTGERIALGLAHIPEDRIRTALVDMSIRDNAVLETIGTDPFSHHGRLDRQAISTFADSLIADYDVRCTGSEQPVLTLSGGNQQKMVLGRALSRDPRFIIAVQPTRGLDVGASSFVHRQLIARRRQGAAILLVSTELEEVLVLSDRVLVMYSGRIAGELPRERMDIHRLAALMVGQTE